MGSLNILLSSWKWCLNPPSNQREEEGEGEEVGGVKREVGSKGEEGGRGVGMRFKGEGGEEGECKGERGVHKGRGPRRHPRETSK